MVLATLLRRALTVVTGAAAGQLIVALSSPVLSRWFSPDDFGLLGAMLGVATTLGTSGALRLELATQLPKSDKESTDIGRLALRTGLATTVVAGLGLAILRALNLGFDSLSFLWLIPLTAFAITTFNTVVLLSVRRGNFRDVARARTWLGAATVAPQLFAGATGAGIIGLLVGPLAGWAVAGLVLLRSTGFDPFAPTESSAMSLLRRYRRFPTYSVASALFNRGALELPPLLLLMLFDQRAAGLFFLCNRVLIVPANVIADGIYQSFLHQSGEASRNDDDVHDQVKRLVRFISTAVVVPIGLAMVVVPPLFPIVFGDAWADAGPMAIRLLPMIAMLLIAVPIASQLWLAGRQELDLIRDGLRFAAVLVVFLISRTFEWDVLTTITAYSAVMSAAYAFTVFLVLRVTSEPHAANTTSKDWVTDG